MAGSEDREQAFRRIYRAHYQQVLAYARRRTTEHEAEDVVAQTFLVAWRRLGDIPPGEEALPWLYGVARRVLSELRRGERRRGRLVSKLVGLAGSRASEPEPLRRAGEHEAVDLALSRLRPKDREVLRLAEWEEMSPREMAAVLGSSVNAATIRLHRARRRFARALSEVEESLSQAGEGTAP